MALVDEAVPLPVPLRQGSAHAYVKPLQYVVARRGSKIHTGQQEGSSADTGGQPGLLILLTNPVQQTGILNFVADASTRHDQNIEGWVLRDSGLRR